MLSDAARRLLHELRSIPGQKLCVVCAGARLDLDRDAVMMTMRELVANGHIVFGQFRCSDCHGSGLTAFQRPFGFRPLDA